jgi:hypothetical protein
MQSRVRFEVAPRESVKLRGGKTPKAGRKSLRDEDTGRASVDESLSNKSSDEYSTGEERKSREPTRRVVGSGAKLRSYEGDPYIEQYLTQFNYTARLEGWPSREWGLHLAAALDEEARRVLQMDHLDPTGTRPSYTKLCARLRETFSLRGTEELWRQKAERYQKGRKESYTKMAQNISEFTAKAFPRMTAEDREPVTVGNFVQAIPVATLRADVRKGRPKTFSEALELVEFLQDVDRVEDRREQLPSAYHVDAGQGNVGSSKTKKQKGGKKSQRERKVREDDNYDGDVEVPDDGESEVTLEQLIYEVP